MKANIVNIGLLVGDASKGILHSSDFVVGMLEKCGFHVAHNAVAQSATEPTLIALVTDSYPCENSRDMAFCTVSEKLGQDCIAVLPLDGTGGYLEGPRAHEWGVFNPNYFIGL